MHNRVHFIFSLLACGFSTLLVLRELDYPLIGIDDANIYFVYARNLAEGHGFVYNIGSERVEGFTSLLWTLIVALAFKVSSQPEIILLIMNIFLVSVGVTYVLGYLSQNNIKHQNIWVGIFLLLLFTSPRYVMWMTTTLMENALWSTLLVVLAVFVVRDHSSVQQRNLGFGVLSGLLLLTRPEAMLWVGVFALVLYFRNREKATLKLLLPALLIPISTIVLLTLFRLWYFGYPLPNTYYAKVSPVLSYNLTQGALYLIRFLLSDPLALMATVLVLIGCVQRIATFRQSQPIDSLPFLVVAGLFVPVLSGGDHFGSFRFYQHILPILLLSAIVIWQQITQQVVQQSHKTLGVITLLVAVFGLSQMQAWQTFASEIRADFNVAQYERVNGTVLQRLFSSLPELPSIGVIASGGIKYSYSGEIIDLLGLNNTLVAHNQGERLGGKNHSAFELNTFYALQPDIVWPILVDENTWHYNQSDLQNRWENKSAFKGLFDQPEFLAKYSYARVGNQTERLSVVAWFKKDLLQTISLYPAFEVEIYEYTP